MIDKLKCKRKMGEKIGQRKSTQQTSVDWIMKVTESEAQRGSKIGGKERQRADRAPKPITIIAINGRLFYACVPNINVPSNTSVQSVIDVSECEKRDAPKYKFRVYTSRCETPKFYPEEDEEYQQQHQQITIQPICIFSPIVVIVSSSSPQFN